MHLTSLLLVLILIVLLNGRKAASAQFESLITDVLTLIFKAIYAAWVALTVSISVFVIGTYLFMIGAVIFMFAAMGTEGLLLAIGTLTFCAILFSPYYLYQWYVARKAA